MKIEKVKELWTQVMKDLSAAVSGSDLSQIAQAFAFARQVEKTIDPKDKSGVMAVAKDKIIEAVKLKGTKTDGASTVLSVGGFKLMMHPTRTGVDPRKLMAKLIALQSEKKASEKLTLVKRYMVAVTSYDLSEELLAKALKDKVLTQQDVKELQYEESWTVKTPTEE